MLCADHSSPPPPTPCGAQTANGNLPNDRRSFSQKSILNPQRLPSRRDAPLFSRSVPLRASGAGIRTGTDERSPEAQPASPLAHRIRHHIQWWLWGGQRHDKINNRGHRWTECDIVRGCEGVRGWSLRGVGLPGVIRGFVAYEERNGGKSAGTGSLPKGCELLARCTLCAVFAGAVHLASQAVVEECGTKNWPAVADAIGQRMEPDGEQKRSGTAIFPCPTTRPLSASPLSTALHSPV